MKRAQNPSCHVNSSLHIQPPTGIEARLYAGTPGDFKHKSQFSLRFIRNNLHACCMYSWQLDSIVLGVAKTGLCLARNAGFLKTA